jgi:hypothetical protein
MVTKKKRKGGEKVALSRQNGAGADAILGRALLCNVRISTWEARKHDRAVTRHVNDEYSASPEAGRYHKNLFGGKVDSHQAVLAAAAAAREKHYELTLPWADGGQRILPTESYFDYVAVVREARDRFYVTLEEFLDEYPQLQRRAKEALAAMYRSEDYPAVGDVRRRFSFDLEFAPLPRASDFRVSLPDEEMERVGRELEAQLARSTQVAMTEAWKRLGEAVGILRGRLDDGRYLRERMVERIAEVAESLGRLNLTGDPKLEELRLQAVADLGALDVDVLRDDEDARTDAATKADNILNAVSVYYAPVG